MYNYLLDKLEDEYDERKEYEEDDEEGVSLALKQSIEKIKQYYAFTEGLIYTVATSKYWLPCIVLLYIYNYLFNHCFLLIIVLDPRIKLEYYKENDWEESLIQEAKKQVTLLWESTYKINIERVAESSDDEDDLYGHIFKKRKLENKDELSIYLNEGLAPRKTDVLTWWKVYIILLLYIFYINDI
jgi:hypothetical protein